MSVSRPGSFNTLQLSAYDGELLQYASPIFPLATEIVAMAPYDDGSGPGIAVITNRQLLLVKEGTATEISGSFDFLTPGTGTLVSVVAHDDGSGPAVYVGGVFVGIDGQSHRYIARWDGLSWSSVGAGLEGEVTALHVHDFGAGPVLVAGGRFTTSGGQSVGRVASWDGTQWSSVGVQPPNGPVLTLASWNDGGSNSLVAGGRFSAADGQVSNSLAFFSAGMWSSFGTGVDHSASGTNGGVKAIFAIDEGAAAETLYIGGRFGAVDGVPAQGLARLFGGTWEDYTQGFQSVPQPGSPSTLPIDINALGAFNFPDGLALVASGTYSYGFPASGPARRGALGWAPLGGATRGALIGRVADAETWDDGNGDALYVGGTVSRIANNYVSRIGKRRPNGTWDAMGPGLNDNVLALTSFDGTLRNSTSDDSGLYVLGEFTGTVDTGTGSIPLNHVCRFDGQNWHPLGAGVELFGVSTPFDLEIYDDGSGARLFALGRFWNLGGSNALSLLAVWDGASWQPFPTPSLLEFYPRCLEVYDDGTGPALYLGGKMRQFNQEESPLMRWDGVSWSFIVDVGAVDTISGPRVNAMRVFDDGTGPKLWLAGQGGSPAAPASSNSHFYALGSLASWDGTSITPQSTIFTSGAWALGVARGGGGPDQLLISGYSLTDYGVSTVGTQELEPFDKAPALLFEGPASGGVGESVYAAGDFISVEGRPVGFFTERIRVCQAGDSFCFGDGGVSPGCTPCPCGNDAPQGTQGGCLNASGASSELLATGHSSASDDSLRFEVRNMSPSTFGVLFSGENRLPANSLNPCFGLDSGVGDGTLLDGLRCMGGPTAQRHGSRGSDASGSIGDSTAGWGPPNGPPGGLINFAGFVAGQTRHFQVFYRDSLNGGCGTGVNTSQGVTVSFLP